MVYVLYGCLFTFASGRWFLSTYARHNPSRDDIAELYAMSDHLTDELAENRLKPLFLTTYSSLIR